MFIFHLFKIQDYSLTECLFNYVRMTDGKEEIYYLNICLDKNN